MKILLDTHAFLWLVMDDPMLSDTAKNLFLDAENEIFLSAVTGFEISVKFSIGKLELSEPPEQFIHNRITKNDLNVLPITLPHTLKLADLPFHHRDPFDRLLIARAMIENVPILTRDPMFSEYDCQVIW
jgi:PIN domain nuclease of toxin-antitoxin system